MFWKSVSEVFELDLDLKSFSKLMIYCIFLILTNVCFVILLERIFDWDESLYFELSIDWEANMLIEVYWFEKLLEILARGS